MPSLLAVLEDKRKSLESERAEIIEKATAAGSFDASRERLDEIDAELPTVLADAARATAERKRIISSPVDFVEGAEGPLGGLLGAGLPKGMPSAPSEQFLASREWREYIEKLAPGGREISSKTRVESPKVPIEGSPMLWLRHGAEVITGGSATSAGALVQPTRLPIVDNYTQRPITLIDLLSPGTTDSDIVEYVRVTSYTKGAASVPEATHIDGADESPANASHKPWAQMALEKVTEAVSTIAVGIPATTRSLSDAGQMRSLIDGQLKYDLALEVERQVIEGSGTDEEFEGIKTVSNTQTQAFDTSIALTLRRALTKVRVGGRTIPNGIAISPETLDDFWAECLASTAPGMAGILLELAQGKFAGKPLVESEGLDRGEAIVADWKRAFLWDRQQATISASSGYMDFFMRNLVAVLAEMRAGFGVIRPPAFVLVDLGS